MAFIRRGNISFLHKPSARIIVHRFDGTVVNLLLREIGCYEEHKMPCGHFVVCIYWGIASMTCVRETFLELDFLLKSQEVRYAQT